MLNHKQSLHRMYELHILRHYVLLLLVFLSHLLLNSAQEVKQTHGCSPFRCGRFGELGFSFSTLDNPSCGLCVLNCTGPVPQLQLHEQGHWHEVHSINYSTQTIEIKVRQIPTQYLDSNASCHLATNFTGQVSPSIFINVTETRTFLKCTKLESHTMSPNKFLQQFRNHTDCKDYDLYFYNDSKTCLPSLPEKISHRCLVVLLPLTRFESRYSCLADNLNLTWDGILRINWQILPVCLDCHRKGGQCLTMPDKTFNCGNLKKGFILGSKLLIGVGTGVVLVILGCIIFIINLRRKRKNLFRSSSLFSQDTCSGPSFKSDLDQGSIYFQTPIFTYKELGEATNQFDSNKILGDGGFGTVYHGKLHDGSDVAVKRLFEHNYQRVEQFMNEIAILSQVCHPHLVSLYGCTNRCSRELLLVYEYVPNGTVADHLHGHHANAGCLTWPIRMSIAVESADALAYLHASDIIHRDIKSSNILLDHGFHVKVGDFGLSRLFPMDVTHVSTAPQGTPGYVDPEYYQCYQLNDKSDVYSFGVVLIELISSKLAVDTSRHRHEINLANMAINKIYNQALHELVDPSLGFDSDYCTRNMIILVAELAFRCLQQEKEMRPCMMEVLENLKGIQREYKVMTTGEMDMPADARFLNKSRTFSPNSVTNKWVSTSTVSSYS